MLWGGLPKEIDIHGPMRHKGTFDYGHGSRREMGGL